MSRPMHRSENSLYPSPLSRPLLSLINLVLSRALSLYLSLSLSSSLQWLSHEAAGNLSTLIILWVFFFVSAPSMTGCLLSHTNHSVATHLGVATETSVRAPYPRNRVIRLVCNAVMLLELMELQSKANNYHNSSIGFGCSLISWIAFSFEECSAAPG